MAPPRHRNRGFSRRIQYGLFFGYVAAAVGVVVALGLVLVARFDPLAFEGIRGAALDLASPITGVGSDVARGAGSVGGEIGSYIDAAHENRWLKGELAATHRALIEAQNTARENVRLRHLLHLIDGEGQPIAVARIAGSSPTGTRRYATLAAGRGEGVRAGQPVRAPEGLVGRVAEAGSGWARVQLVTDGGSAVPVRLVRTGQPALAIGRGEGTLDVRSTLTGAQPFRRGDLLVTSGTGGVYPAGLPVAVVTAPNGEMAIAQPLAAASQLDVALVLPEVAQAPPPPVGKQ